MFLEVAAMVILVLAMVITIIMTIASTKMTVSGGLRMPVFDITAPQGERTDKRQELETPLPDAETAEMYIYTLSEKYLRYGMAY